MADKSDWKKKEPSDAQLKFLNSLGCSETPKTAGEASQLINKFVLVQKLNKIREKLIKDKIVPQDTHDKIVKGVDSWFFERLITYCALADNCVKFGFDEPAQIGMFFNNYNEDKRKC